MGELEGGIHIVRITNDKYVMTFAAYSGPGGAVPTREFAGREPADSFLKEIGVPVEARQNALDELRTRSMTTVGFVRVRVSELKRLGLIE
jgi:hypothetical protein